MSSQDIPEMQSWKSRTSQISQDEIRAAAEQAGIADQIVQPVQQQQNAEPVVPQQPVNDNGTGRYNPNAAVAPDNGTGRYNPNAAVAPDNGTGRYNPNSGVAPNQNPSQQQHRPSAVQQALDAAKAGPWQQDMAAAQQQSPPQQQPQNGSQGHAQQSVQHATTSSYGSPNGTSAPGSAPVNVEGRQYRQALNTPTAGPPGTVADNFKQASQAASSGQHGAVSPPVEQANNHDLGIYTGQFRRDRFGGLDPAGLAPQASTTAIPAAPQFAPPPDATGPLAAPTPNQAYVNATTGVQPLNTPSYSAVSMPTSATNVVDPTAERSFVPPELQNKENNNKPKELPLPVLIIGLVLVVLAGVAAGWFIFKDRGGSETSTGAAETTEFSAQLLNETGLVSGPVQVSETTPYKVQALNVPDGVQAEVSLDGQPVALVDDGFPIGFSTPGRHTIEVKAEGETPVAIAQYAFTPKTAPDFVAELALLKKEDTPLAEALNQFDGLKANHENLELIESGFFKDVQEKHYILFVGGFESQEMADAYCKESGADPCTARELAPE